MDEVDAMARAGESVGKAVGTGLRAARRGAVRAGQAGAGAAAEWAERTEARLAERGVTADHIRAVVADRAGALVEKAEEVEKSTRRTRKQLAKKAKGIRKDVAKAADLARREAKSRAKDVRKAAKQARKDFAAPEKPKKHRKWPWLLAILAAGAVAACVALSRRPQEVHLEEVDEVETERTEHTDPPTADPSQNQPHGETQDQTLNRAARNGRSSDQNATDRS